MTGHALVPPQDRDGLTPYLGMVIALASFAMLFAALMLSYVLLRVQQPIWPPLGSPPLPLGFALLNTGVLLASSVTLVLAGRQLSAGKLAAFSRLVLGTLLLGVAFLALQVFLWDSTHRAGLTLSGVFGSVFYVLTWMHALHLVAGVVALAWLHYGARQRRFTASRQVPVTLVAMFWHFLDVVWLAMFVGIFVL